MTGRDKARQHVTGLDRTLQDKTIRETGQDKTPNERPNREDAVRQTIKKQNMYLVTLKRQETT